MAPVFLRSLALVLAVRCRFWAADLTALESFSLRIGTGPNPQFMEIRRGEKICGERSPQANGRTLPHRKWTGRHWRSCTQTPRGLTWAVASIGWRSVRT